jgi:hypothetical protein
LGVSSADKINDLNEKRPFSMVEFPDTSPVLLVSPVTTPTEETRPGMKSKHSFGYHSLTSGLSGTMRGLSLNALSEKIGSGFSANGAFEKDAFKAEGVAKESLGLEREIDSAVRSPHLKIRKLLNEAYSCGGHSGVLCAGSDAYKSTQSLLSVVDTRRILSWKGDVFVYCVLRCRI